MQNSLSNREKALMTHAILEKRKAERKHRAEGDFLAYTAMSVDRVYKRNYEGRKRRGQP